MFLITNIKLQTFHIYIYILIKIIKCLNFYSFKISYTFKYNKFNFSNIVFLNYFVIIFFIFQNRKIVLISYQKFCTNIFYFVRTLFIYYILLLFLHFLANNLLPIVQNENFPQESMIFGKSSGDTNHPRKTSLAANVYYCLHAIKYCPLLTSGAF